VTLVAGAWGLVGLALSLESRLAGKADLKSYLYLGTSSLLVVVGDLENCGLLCRSDMLLKFATGVASKTGKGYREPELKTRTATAPKRDNLCPFHLHNLRHVSGTKIAEREALLKALMLKLTDKTYGLPCQHTATAGKLLSLICRVQ
jgi:hypothetical protein